MTSLLHYLLTLVLLYEYPIVAVVVFLSYLGLPMPASTILLAAGSFCASGNLNIYILILLVTFVALLGDIVDYYIGYKVGHQLVTTYGSKFGLTAEKMKRIDQHLDKWGGSSIFITRWLITPLGVPVSLLAGIRKYPMSKFLFCTGSGELLWAVLYVGLGYIFGANWQVVVDYISNAPQIFTLTTIGSICLIFALVQLRKKNHTSVV